MWLFDPPGYGIDALPQWREYVAMLERSVVEDENPEESREELKHARRTLARLEEKQARARAA
jgi:hypothetical protein